MITFKKGSKKKITPNFSEYEFECHCKDDHENHVDEQLIIYLQALRDFWGRSVKINSGYRCTAWNKKQGGSKKSYHMEGIAADIEVKGIDPRLVRSEMARFGPRVGHYVTFTHVDLSGRADFIGKY